MRIFIYEYILKLQKPLGAIAIKGFSLLGESINGKEICSRAISVECRSL